VALQSDDGSASPIDDGCGDADSLRIVIGASSKLSALNLAEHNETKTLMRRDMRLLKVSFLMGNRI
jgi:hypothetical protein